MDGELVPIPVNITTVNTLFDLQISNEEEMQRFPGRGADQEPQPEKRRGGGAGQGGAGALYEKMFKHYTKKQWDRYPHELDASVLQRIPVRTNFDDRYFEDKYQALPLHGYTKVFEAMLSHPNIEVRLNTDYFNVR